jgi:hypothetical protein
MVVMAVPLVMLVMRPATVSIVLLVLVGHFPSLPKSRADMYVRHDVNVRRHYSQLASVSHAIAGIIGGNAKFSRPGYFT